MKSNPGLYFHEWSSVLTLITVLSILTLISHTNESTLDLGPPHYIQDNTVEIYVSGAVECAGVFRVPHGTTIGQVMSQAKPLPSADLSSIKMGSKITRGRHLKVKAGKKQSRRGRQKVEKSG